MTRWIRAFFGSLIAFLVTDILWIRFFVRPLYQSEVGHLLRETPDLLGAIGFYFCYLAATVYFAVAPGLRAGSAKVAALNGALLGGITYATYSMTNYAVFAVWTPILVLTDIPWGMFLTAVSAIGGYLAAKPRQGVATA